MKYFRYIITIFLCLMAINVHAATSKFEPIISMEPEIQDNQISIVVGYNGENIMALTQNIAYEKDYLTLLDVSSMDNFVVTKGNEQQDGNFNTLKLLADSDYAFEDINYAILTFELNDKFKVGKSSTIFMYTYESIGPNKDRYRHKGYEMTLRRDEIGQMVFLLKIIDSSTKREYWLSQNYLMIVAVVLVIGGIVATIFLIPTKRKREARSKKISGALSDKNQLQNSKDVDPIKIDYDFIENLGSGKKEVDMSQAIEVSDLKPFGEAEGKYVNNESQEVSSMNSLNQEETPESKVPEATPNNSMEETKEDTSLINPFNMTLENLSNEEQVNSEINNNLNEKSNPKSSDVENEIKEIPEEKNEDLILFQPTFDDNNKESNNIKNMSFILIFILSLSLIIPNVKAIDYRVSELRDCIVGNIPYNFELDYNNDGKIDVVDIIETKDLSNVILQEDISR